MKTLISIGIFSLLAFMGWVENDSSGISGKVTESSSGDKVIVATVKIYKDNNLITQTETDFDGFYNVKLDRGIYDVEVSYVGLRTQRVTGVVVRASEITKVDMIMQEHGHLLDQVEIVGYKVPLVELDNTTQGTTITSEDSDGVPNRSISSIAGKTKGVIVQEEQGGQQQSRSKSKRHSEYYIDGIRVTQDKRSIYPEGRHQVYNDANEEYNRPEENAFKTPLDEAYSTFGLDVDKAGYSNIRRIINNGQLPQPQAVRVEEMINYFNYDYPLPKGKDPLEISPHYTTCPWNADHKLLHVGVKTKEIELDNLPPSNLVFLLDVSGSMNSPNKLPLLISSFKLLLDNLRDEDRVAIVTYAGHAGVALQSTSIKEKETILKALDNLRAGGSTAGADGILTAYKIAHDHFIEKGNNRVILATDGDFNVGVSNADDLEALIEQKRQSGIFLSVLGFGQGNYKDHRMQTLADKGNGNHAYIDNIMEAKKIFINEFGGTLFTVAKDVKIQIEFNPAYVSAYRLIGYENRMLAKEDFNDDTKDAGELGVGHTVTAIYEIVPVGSSSAFALVVDPLLFQQAKPADLSYNKQLAHIKCRYKDPNKSRSKKFDLMVRADASELSGLDNDIKFGIAVAEFGMHIAQSRFLVNSQLDGCITLAKQSKGKDQDGYRSEFVRLAESVSLMNRGDLSNK